MGARQSQDVNEPAVEPTLQTNTEHHPLVTGKTLKFHDVFGKHIELSMDKKVAKRTTSYNCGIVFSNDSININELAAIEVIDSIDHWSGEMRLGVTRYDPSYSDSNSLPPSACPYLQQRDGYWVAGVPEGFSQPQNQIAVYLNQNGILQLALNGDDFNEFLKDVPTDIPLWIVFEVFGCTGSIRMIDTHSQINSRKVNQREPRLEVLHFEDDADTDSLVELVKTISLLEFKETAESSRNVDGFSGQASSSGNEVLKGNGGLNMDEISVDVMGNPHGEVLNQLMAVYNISLSSLESTKFSSTCGSGVVLVDDDYAIKNEDVTTSCIVFSDSPIKPGDTFYFKIVRANDKPITILGVTECDPATLDVDQLPRDCNQLLSREECWQVETTFSELNDGDLLVISYGFDGFLTYDVNRTVQGRLCNCDRQKNLWLFLDLSSNVESIFMAGYSKG